jgi:hypothetical protein
MTNERPTPVDHQATCVQDIAAVPVRFRWIGYSPVEGTQKTNG